MIIAIVAVDSNWAIGKNNTLLFKLQKDMDRFKTITTNKGAGGIVAMGENTLKSFPKSKALKDRVNLVLAKEGHDYEDCIMFYDFNNMVKYIQILSKVYNIYIIGGAMFYKSMLQYCDQIYVTKVDAVDNEADVFFPNLDENKNFKLDSETSWIKDNNYNIKFVTYKKRIK